MSTTTTAMPSSPTRPSRTCRRAALGLAAVARGRRRRDVSSSAAARRRTSARWAWSWACVDAMRVGPDSGVNWGGVDRTSVARCSAASLYFLNGRVWWNDPDSIYARARVAAERSAVLCRLGHADRHVEQPDRLGPGLSAGAHRSAPADDAVPPVDERPPGGFPGERPGPGLGAELRDRREKHTVIGLFNWGGRGGGI